MDLFDLYETTTTNPKFLMRAPLSTVQDYLDSHPDAVKRVLHETSTLGVPCELHVNRGPKGGRVYRVYKAYKSLPASLDAE